MLTYLILKSLLYMYIFPLKEKNAMKLTIYWQLNAAG